MSHKNIQLTRGDRARRRERIARAYAAGQSSRAVAAQFGVTDSFVRSVARDAGIARPPGRPLEMARLHVGFRAAQAIFDLPTSQEQSA